MKLLNCGVVSHWLYSSRMGRHHRTWWAWQQCCSYSCPLLCLCDVLLVSNKGWNSRGNRFTSSAEQLYRSTAALQWIMNFSLRFTGIINMSDPTSSAISWDLSLSCGSLSYGRCPGFTFPALISWQALISQKGVLLHHIRCSTFLVFSAMLQRLIKSEIVAFHPGSVFGQRCSSACSEVTPMMNMLDMLHIRISFQLDLCSWVCLPLLPGGNWIWGLLGGWRRCVGGREKMNEAKIEGEERKKEGKSEVAPAAHMPAGQVLTWQHAPLYPSVLKWELLHKIPSRIADQTILCVPEQKHNYTLCEFVSWVQFFCFLLSMFWAPSGFAVDLFFFVAASIDNWCSDEAQR